MVLFVLVLVVIVDAASTDESSEASDPTTAPPLAPTAAPTAGTPEPAPEPPGFGDGTYLVGTDIQPGLYRADGGRFCSWQRLSDLSGEYDAVLGWEFSDGLTYVEILPTDVAFSTDDCGRWEPAAFDGPDVSSGFEDGTFLVGSDIQPGTYRSTGGGSGCSWQRLSDLTGDYDAVLAWEFSEGQAYAEIQPTDVAFSTDGCGTWSRVG
ncbi:hypothetical protein [Geodermatophilus sp. SYSU D00710]